MSVYEYSRWDGSQEFQPQSADKLFEKLSEFMMQYGDQVLRNLDDLDNDARASPGRKSRSARHLVAPPPAGLSRPADLQGSRL